MTDADKAYLTNLPLSDNAKQRVEDFIEYAIAQLEDAFRSDPANRTQPDTRYFQMQLILFDKGGDGRFHRLDFFVSDENAPHGVLRVVYVDHQ
jgi:hypothetical protein